MRPAGSTLRLGDLPAAPLPLPESPVHVPAGDPMQTQRRDVPPVTPRRSASLSVGQVASRKGGVRGLSRSPSSPLRGRVSSERTQFLLQRRWAAHSAPPLRRGFEGGALCKANSLLAGPRRVLNTHRKAWQSLAHLPPSAPHPAPSRNTHPRAPGAGFGRSSPQKCCHSSDYSVPTPSPPPRLLPELPQRRGFIALLSRPEA